MAKQTEKPKAEVIQDKQPMAEFIQDGHHLYVLCRAMQEYIQDAEKLSYLHDWDDDRTSPRIEVRWKPVTTCYSTATSESIHKYHVQVDGIRECRDWEIISETKEDLRSKLATCMDEYAEYLEEMAKFLRDQSEYYRRDAAHEAHQAKQGWQSMI